ncbi:MAG: zinc-binding dehydrogenase [Chloroflexi bacterium]|nr:zinc-binding dehydrogenase [Chloroflexota bacterium]
MKAVQLVAHRTFEQVDIAEPVPAEGQAKIKVEAVSPCASDIHGSFDAHMPEEKYPLAPGMPCHEIVGTVVESKTDEINVGQRAIVLPTPGMGGMVEYITQSPDRIIPIPDWGPIDEWMMCQHSGTVLFAAKHWGNPAGKRIAVLGQGGIGLSFTMIAEKQGARQVIGIDLLDYRLKKAQELGATDTVNPDKDNLIEALEEITGGEGVDVVVDATGDPDGLETCIHAVKRHGTILGFSLTGSEGKRASFVHGDWMRKAVTIIPTQIAGTDRPTDEIRDMVALKERGWMDPGLLKTHNLTFNDAQRAYDMYTDRDDEVIKVAMNFPG